MNYPSPPPDPTNPDLLINLRDYLITNDTAAIVRLPDDNTNSLPPMWIEPRYGVPAPGEASEGGAPTETGNNVTTGINLATGIPSAPFEGFIRRDCVRFVVRGVNSQLCIEFESNVRILINDRRGWTMVNVPVNESLLFRAMSPVSRDEQGFTFMFEYLFVLWGPYQPPEGP